MASVQQALGPLFLLIVVGALLGWRRFPGEGFWNEMERMIYYILFPAMLVSTLARADMASVPVMSLASVMLGAMLIFSVVLWLCWRHAPNWLNRHLGDAASFTSLFQGSIRFNSYVGVAGAAALHGAAGATVAAVALALMVPAANLLCVMAFIGSGTLGEGGLLRSLKALTRNPLVLACLAGTALNLSGIGLPGWSGDAISLLGRAALPLGLVAVGVALRPRVLITSGSVAWLASLLKLMAMPALVVASCQLVGLTGIARDVAILFAALPTATSAYILARQLGGNAELMAALITAQTLLAMLTLPFWLTL
ncbi:AEC family transporter [Cobetia sp. L2A1]|uniref:AEC family transporter n=1 Tax=Cobetia sp. L2A1 TaxID=2686360 RepID=UPI00131B3F4B|nr:AEC family transporter [Cobetia sp. L2A1]